MNLLVDALKQGITDVARARNVHPSFRVQEKVNARGELVVALIVPPTHPDQWVMAAAAAQENGERKKR